MKCLKCSNIDKRYFVIVNGNFHCRKCLVFDHGIINKLNYSFNENLDAEYKLGFDLTLAQKQVSSNVLKYIKAKEDVLIYAACGTGKTEIILETLKYALNKGLKVGIAIPRRQVVLELRARMAEYFTNIKVIAVCEGFTQELFADLIICTTHQLYNYQCFFDLLIIDEPDAFPFANNPLLLTLAKNSVKGNTIYMSATPTKEMKKLKTLTLFRRYHGHDLLVPTVVVNFKIFLYIKLLRFIQNNDKVLLFVPSISLAKKLSKLLQYPCIHSKSTNKDEVIRDFEAKVYKVLITTTIMERGITIEGVNICVLFADHIVFNEASLIQIAGRVGRKATKPFGNGIFLCQTKSEQVDKCIQELEMMNA